MFYPHPYVPMTGGVPYAAWQIAGAAALLVLATALVLRARGRRYLAVGWLWYLGTLVPVIGLVQIGSQAYADRYSYFPSIGLFIIAAIFAIALITNDPAAARQASCSGAASCSGSVGCSGSRAASGPVRGVVRRALSVRPLQRIRARGCS